MFKRSILVLLCSFALTACLGGSDDDGPTCGDLVCEGDEGATCAADCQAGEGILRVENRSSFVIVELYVSACSESTWGPNQLSGVLSPGYYVAYTVDVGCYDVRAVAAEGAGDVTEQIYVADGDTFVWPLVDATGALTAAPTR